MSTDTQPTIEEKSQQAERELGLWTERVKRYITRDHEEDVRHVVFELNFALALGAALLFLISRLSN